MAIDEDVSSGDGFGAVELGTLRLSGDCVLYETETEMLVPVFPAGTQWDPDNSSIQLPDDSRSLALGDLIELGGGQVEEASESMTVPQDCPDDLTFFVVAPTSGSR